MRIAPTPLRRRFVVGILIVAGLLLCAGAAAAFLNHERVSRANDLAVHYGLASSSGNASVQSRCVARVLENYDQSTDPGKAGVPPQAFKFLAPKACALAIRRGLVRPDGTMNVDVTDGELIVEAGNQFGKSRVQKMIFTELAVYPYHLAPSKNEVTRWDRCVAMGLSGYDAQASKSALPDRALWGRAVRRMCTLGVRRGLVPPSGAPDQRLVSKLLAEAFADMSGG